MSDWQITYSLTFTNGSGGVFTAYLPEPTGLALLAIPTAALLVRRSRT